MDKSEMDKNIWSWNNDADNYLTVTLKDLTIAIID
jgi:hypothetical protein